MRGLYCEFVLSRTVNPNPKHCIPPCSYHRLLHAIPSLIQLRLSSPLLLPLLVSVEGGGLNNLSLSGVVDRGSASTLRPNLHAAATHGRFKPHLAAIPPRTGNSSLTPTVPPTDRAGSPRILSLWVGRLASCPSLRAVGSRSRPTPTPPHASLLYLRPSPTTSPQW